MEKGEFPEETAVREIEEECGIEGPKIERFLGNTYHTYAYNGKPTLKKTWWYAMSYSGPKELCPQTEESITQAVWFTKKEWEIVRAKTFSSIGEVLKMY
jgi:8-oxo-dGTP pyrophosphatase MutT (NUDIX family)